MRRLSNSRLPFAIALWTPACDCHFLVELMLLHCHKESTDNLQLDVYLREFVDMHAGGVQLGLMCSWTCMSTGLICFEV